MAVPSPVSLPALAAVPIALFGVRVLLTLLHELGHATVALTVTDGMVHVVVGRTPGLRLRLGRLRIEVSPVPARGVGWDGLTVPERQITKPRRAFAYFLAGPLVSALCVVALAIGTAIAAHAGSWVLMWTCMWSFVIALGAVLINANPRSSGLTEHDGRPSIRDGPRALAAYRAARGKQQLPPDPRSPDSLPPAPTPRPAAKMPPVGWTQVQARTDDTAPDKRQPRPR